jgi:hypothetical protein
MSLRIRAARLALVAMVLVGSSAAQLVDPLERGLGTAWIEKGLRSEVPLAIASAAEGAKRDLANNQLWAPLLRQALKKSASLQPESEALRVKRALFDALIQTRISVPLEELLPFFDEFPAAVIGVIARASSPHNENLLPLLLKTQEWKNGIYWTAIASLMRPEILSHLAHDVRFEYQVFVSDQDFAPILVYDPGRVPGGIRGGVLGGVIGGPLGWPDEIVYEISPTGRDEDRLTCCIAGRSTYLIGRNSRSGGSQTQTPDWPDHNHEILLELLSRAHCAICSRSDRDFPMIRGGKAAVVWHSEEQMRKALTDLIGQYVRECQGLILQLGQSGSSEAEIRNKIRIWIIDQRRVRTGLIPLIQAGVEIRPCGTYDGRCR